MIIIQFDDGKRPIYSKAIDQVMSSKPASVRHTLITSSCGHDVRNSDYRAASEIVRLTEACINPEMFWLDSDVLIKKWPDFEFKPGKPYCSEKWFEAIFFVNGCCDFFRDLFKEYENKRLHKSCWLRRLFRDHLKEFELIPEGYFVHMTLSAAVLARENFSNYATKDFRVFRDKNGELKFDIRF